MKSQDAGPTDTPILEETIGENFERTVAANPDGDALVDMASGRRWTYAELNDEIDVVARGLMALGIERGDRVGIWAPNCPEWTIVQYATAKIGAILVNINPGLPHPRTGLRAASSRVSARWSPRRRSRRRTTSAWSTRCGPRRRDCRRSSSSVPTTGRDLRRQRADAVTVDELCATG